MKLKKEYIIAIVILFIFALVIIYKIIKNKDKFTLPQNRPCQLKYFEPLIKPKNNKPIENFQTQTYIPNRNNNFQTQTYIPIRKPILKFQNIGNVKNTILKAKIDVFPTFLNTFLLYVFTKCAPCPNKELQINGICSKASSKFVTEYGRYVCGVPETKPECSEKNNNLETSVIPYILDNFKHYNLLTSKRGTNDILNTDINSRYYLFNTFKKLSWQNIKSINSDDVKNLYENNREAFIEIHNLFCDFRDKITAIPTENNFKDAALYMQYIFWYFRRAIVDTILSPKFKELNILGISVGSTNVTSDYDMTIYCKNISNLTLLMEYYRNEINKLFNDPSELVFDTNLYGMSSWIYLINDITEGFSYIKLFSPEIKTCSNKQFKYLMSDENTPISQHIWALVKLLTCIEHVQTYDDIVYSKLMSKLEKITQRELLSLLLEAYKTVNLYPSDVSKLPILMSSIKKMPPGKITLNYFNNYLSYISYNSPESYYTRGSFLHTVLNGQTCKSAPESQKLKLTQDEYLDSFIENMSELISHFRKDKYIKRAKESFIKFYSSSAAGDKKIDATFAGKILEKINKIQSEQDFCNGVPLECSPFSIMDEVLDILINVLTNYFQFFTEIAIKNGIDNFIIEDKNVIL